MSAVFMVPAEIVDRCLRPAAQADLIRLMLAGARPQPLVMLRILNGAWVARYAFHDPVRTADGMVDAFQATLAVHPEGGLG
jgi:hypothetical protein